MFDFILSLTTSNGDSVQWWELLILFVGIAFIISTAGFWILIAQRDSDKFNSKKVGRIYLCSKEDYEEYISSLNKKNNRR